MRIISKLWICVFISIVISCKKDATSEPDPPLSPIPPVVNDTVSVSNKNVVIIDTTALVLTSDSSDLVLGKYKFTIVRNVPVFKANDVIVGESRGGYIRKVQSINNINIWTQAAIGVNASILGKSLFDFKKEWKSDPLTYTTPFTLERISGDNQKGEPEKYLSQPLKVKVLDIEGNPETNAYVNFGVKKGGGSLEQAIVKTNHNGEVSVRWKLGKVTTEIQTAEGIAKNSDGSLIGGSPVEFAAIAGIDTAAILVSHGAWKATEGVFEDLAFGTFGEEEYYDNCDGISVYGQFALDEISLIFGNSSGANISSKERLKGNIITSTNPCVITVGEKNISSSVDFEWTYLPELKKIRATSITDDGFFDMDKGEYFDFTNLAFSETAMEITGTPPGWGILHLKLK
ncbi:MAG: hypothetical protein ACXWWA_10500 [Chitinophagaceae bacterium]